MPLLACGLPQLRRCPNTGDALAAVRASATQSESPKHEWDSCIRGYSALCASLQLSHIKRGLRPILTAFNANNKLISKASGPEERGPQAAASRPTHSTLGTKGH